MAEPFSLEIERYFLASLLRHPKKFVDYRDHFDDSLFYNDTHKIIANAMANQFDSHKQINQVLVCDYLARLGLSHQDDINIPDYISRITKRNACADEAEIETYFKECYKYKLARTGISNCEKTKRKILANLSGTIKDIIAATETGMTLISTSFLENENSPIDLYDGLPEFVETLNEGGNDDGIKTPFKTWNRWFGHLTKGDLTVISAPAKAGKSTILNYIADVPFCKYNQGKSIKVLILDTELETYRVRTRKCAGLSNINEFFIKSAKWQKNAEMTEKVHKAFETMKQRKGSVYHSYVANVPIEEVCSIVRRWKALYTNPEDECLIIYDYLKITNEKISDANKEYQVMGAKCTMLKDLMSELQCAGLAAIQTNAARDVAMSQRIKWFVSSLFLFYKKTPEELSEHGERFGTHVLTPVVLRNLGPDWIDEEYVKEQTSTGITYTTNQLFLQLDNFSIKEAGTLDEFVKFAANPVDITEGSEEESRRKPVLEEIEL